MSSRATQRNAQKRIEASVSLNDPLGGYLRYTGRDANVVAKAARDPKRLWGQASIIAWNSAIPDTRTVRRRADSQASKYLIVVSSRAGSLFQSP
jgi:hypothetical protein